MIANVLAAALLMAGAAQAQVTATGTMGVTSESEAPRKRRNSTYAQTLPKPPWAPPSTRPLCLVSSPLTPSTTCKSPDAMALNKFTNAQLSLRSARAQLGHR
jgi:hypothetical protein